MNPSDEYPAKVDLNNCDREPIHLIGTSQSNGVIIACDRKDLKITHCSENSGELLGIDSEKLLGNPISILLPEAFSSSFPDIRLKKQLLPEIDLNGAKFLIIAHRSEDSIILDFEPLGAKRSAVNFQKQLSRILNELNSSKTIEDLTLKAASLVKSVFRYDRVMIYQFDEEWNGEVIAEEKEEELESWLGLRYPSTDIPKPSRELFLKQDIRIISDVNYDPARIISLDNNPLDLSLSELRGVSPIHIEYLKNMGVGASLTAAIIIKGKLWGLLACHHYSRKFINYYQRQSVKFLTQIYTNSLGVHTAQDYVEKSKSFGKVKNEILSRVRSQQDILNALTTGETPFTYLVPCTGGAVFINGELRLLGKTPSETEVLKLLEGFLDKQREVFHTRNLEKVYLPALNFKEKASGILAVSIGDMTADHLIWFRGESSTAVSWGGNPEEKGIIKDGIEHLSPRKSFEKWTCQESGISDPWMDHEIEAVNALREGITHIIVNKQKDEIRQLNHELKTLNKDLESFNYSISHDLRAPLRGLTGFAQILREKNLDALNKDGRRSLDIIERSAKEMNNLIEDLLSYSKLGRSRLKKTHVDVVSLVENILESFNIENEYPQLTILVDRELPFCNGDKILLHQLFSNLIDNAIKYSGKSPHPIVEIGFKTENNEVIYFVKDNGIGIDPKLTDKIFNVFLRLAGDEYPGTGVGLATVKKVIEKHGGHIWVETNPGMGTCFYFSLNARS
jgi:two-component system, chemotaxis family, sensor kinase Cph1